MYIAFMVSIQLPASSPPCQLLLPPASWFNPLQVVHYKHLMLPLHVVLPLEIP